MRFMERDLYAQEKIRQRKIKVFQEYKRPNSNVWEPSEQERKKQNYF